MRSACRRALCRTTASYDTLRQSALAFGVVDVTRIGPMLKAAITPTTPEHHDRKVVAIGAPRFARPTAHFETRTTTTREGA